MDTEKFSKDVRPTLNAMGKLRLIRFVSHKYGFLKSNIIMSPIEFLLILCKYDADLPMMGSNNFVCGGKEYVVHFFVPEPYSELEDKYAFITLG